MAEIAPIVLSLIVCDQVIVDARTGKPSIIGDTQTISAYKYPAKLPRLTFFFELTGGHGNVNVKVALVDVQEEDKRLFEGNALVHFKDPKQVVWNSLQTSVVFPHAGEYRFQLYGANELLLERWIVCRQSKPPKRGDTKGKS